MPGRVVGEGVNVNGVSRSSPGLDLLCHFLGVGGSEDVSDAGVFERVGKGVQEVSDGIRQTNGGQDSRSKKRVTAESIKKRVFGAGDVGVNPLEIG